MHCPRKDVYLHFPQRSFSGKLLIKNKQDEKFHGIWGEAAFTTALSGYQETMTDPSYSGQHILFTFPHIGNYPANPAVMQSNKIHAASILARHITLNEYLAKQDIPIVDNLDTREITKFLVQNPQHISYLSLDPNPPATKDFQWDKLTCNDLSLVSQKNKKVLREGDNPIVLINYGCKKAIENFLLDLELPLVSLEYTASTKEVLSHNPRLIFLSNGPGDPKAYTDQIDVVKELLKSKIPMRGICLGHQLLGLAMGLDTVKLPFGHRGTNHPVQDHTTGKVLITSQNHGHAIDEKSFQENFEKLKLVQTHSSLFDHTLEGMSTQDHLIKSVQYHPEAYPGPHDAQIFFDEIKNYLSNNNKNLPLQKSLYPLIDIKSQPYKKKTPYKKILVIGSGPIRIGQASEFDYSGTQAIKALKEEGIEVVLVNSNPATIMTDREMAHKTYIEPLIPDMVEKIIIEEKVDAVLSTMGGQTALNLCLNLEQKGFLKAHNVKLLGARYETIFKTENREQFSKEMTKLGYSTGMRFQVASAQEALKVADESIGFPLILRRDFALGGQGAQVIDSLFLLEKFLEKEENFPITLEKSLHGQKEIELEVMVDCEQNSVIICSIENIDPCGIHTGDSITVAPAQTLSDHCYQNLRTMALTIARHMGIEAGGANVQFAINPDDENDITVIEMNPRVSRSSALASKATGYPIAKISAQLAIGYTLKEILNDITLSSPVSFEPTLDYVAIKVPLFPYKKFPNTPRQLGPQMRSVGEVLALGGNFNEALLKAFRSLELGLEIPELSVVEGHTHKEDLLKRLGHREQLCLLSVLEALRLGVSNEDIFQLTQITPWFTEQLNTIIDLEKKLIKQGKEFLEQKDLFLECKKNGLSDIYISKLTETSEEDVFKSRMKHGLRPSFKAVDTCSGEFVAQTPYYYSTYQNQDEIEAFDEKSVIIIGSGPNRIGQGIEFDYSCVRCSWAFQKEGIKTIFINSNPETVSTDYDSSDRLYLSPLHPEDICDIFLKERPFGIVTSFSGQTGIHIREEIEKSFRKDYGPFPFLGPLLETLELTEDRKLFEYTLEENNLPSSTSYTVNTISKFQTALKKLGYPIIIRPNYVIGGDSMYILYDQEDYHALNNVIKAHLDTKTGTFLVQKYLLEALEYDVDLVRDQFDNTVIAISEHIEHAGVHSGDSGMITPPLHAEEQIKKRMATFAKKLANALDLIGPLNIQFAIKNDKIFCIEANPRGSRTIPFLSKAFDIPLVDYSVQSMLGKELPNITKFNHTVVSVKQSTFPFDRFLQDKIILGPIMRSTGETMGMDKNLYHALLKSILSNHPEINIPGAILVSLANTHKKDIIPLLQKLHVLQYKFYATAGTYKEMQKHNIPCKRVEKIGSNGHSLLDIVRNIPLKMVLNTPMNQGKSHSDGELIRSLATAYAIPCFTRAENIQMILNTLIKTHGEDIRPFLLQGDHHENS